MSKIRSILAAFASVAPLFLIACSGSDALPIGSEARSAPDAKSPTVNTTAIEPGADWTDAKGQVWKWRRHVELTPDGEAVPPPSYEPCDHACVEKLSDERFAELLKPVMLRGSEEYILSEMDLAIAKQIRNGTYVPPITGGPGWLPPKLPDQPNPGPEIVIGPTDDRLPDFTRIDRSIIVLGPNLSYFNTGTGSCSAFLIGRSTALSAAHCFFNSLIGGNGPFGWISPSGDGWAAGVFTYASNPPITTTAYTPPGLPCYDVAIPFGHYVTDDIYFDYAVMEFSRECNLFPGDTTGWHAWSTTTNDQIQNTGGDRLGYPASPPAQWAGVFPHPTLYQQLIPPGLMFAFPYNFPPQYAVYGLWDSTGGDSGGPVELYLNQQPTAIAINKGNPNSSINWARRIDATVIYAVVTTSAWPN